MRRLLLILLLGTAVPAAEPDKTSPPNIVVILADDLGYGDLRCYNPQGKIPTPNIDRMAAEGMRFTDAHSASAVCTPTRYGLLTGRYCWRTRLKKGVLGGWSPHLIEDKHLTVASLLKAQGYRTGCIGKWHLGMDWPAADQGFGDDIEPARKWQDIDFTKPVTRGPNAAGPDSYSIAPWLRGEKPDKPTHPFIVHHSIDGLFALRCGDWKFIDGKGSGGWSKDAPVPTTGQLYNLASDPAEQNNLYDKEPALVAELSALLNECRATAK